MSVMSFMLGVDLMKGKRIPIEVKIILGLSQNSKNMLGVIFVRRKAIIRISVTLGKVKSLTSLNQALIVSLT